MSSFSSSIELGVKKKLLDRSFARVAAFFSADIDHSSTVFRRFDQLALRNLLYLQAKLASLEDKQREYDEEDLQGDLETKAAASSWLDFDRLAKTPERPGEADRMKLADEIQETLKKYQEALILHSGVLALPDPPETTVSAYKIFFNLENGETRLRKESSKILEDENDLASLRFSTSRDRLTSFVLNHMGWLFAIHSNEIDMVRNKSIARFVLVISTIAAAILLIGAVAALNYAQPQYHMVILGLFTAGFAAFVALLTSATQGEVFSASCAYAAVLVVFLGTNGNSSSPTGTS